MFATPYQNIISVIYAAASRFILSYDIWYTGICRFSDISSLMPPPSFVDIYFYRVLRSFASGFVFHILMAITSYA